MRFKAGVLGVCVIIIAISATLLGSWVMSMDVNESEVTKYNALTEITGLFESEQTPTFTEYSPSTNYTGYYTEDSIIGGTTYFDGVDFTQSNNPNNFRIQPAPGESLNSTYDLDQLSEYDSDYRYVMYADYQNDQFYLKRNDDSHGNNGGKTVSLEALVTALNTGHDYNYIKLYSTDNYNQSTPYGQNVSVDWCVFSSKSDWNDYRGSYNFLYPSSASALAHPSSAYSDYLTSLKLSAIVDLKLNEVTLYADNSFTTPAGAYSLSDVLITISGGEPTAAVPAGYIEFGHVINIDAANLPDPVYMDPSKGVEML